MLPVVPEKLRTGVVGGAGVTERMRVVRATLPLPSVSWRPILYVPAVAKAVVSFGVVPVSVE